LRLSEKLVVSESDDLLVRKAHSETVGMDHLLGGWLFSLREVPRDATSAALTKSRPSNDREVYP
jgi:hypothetical protein